MSFYLGLVVSDLDGVLADPRHRRAYCPTVDPTYTWDDYFAGCDDDELLPEGYALINIAKTAGCRVHIITNRSENGRSITANWLIRKNVPYDVLVTRPPSVPIELGRQMKIDHARELLADGHRIRLWVEDDPDTAQAIADLGIAVLSPNPRYDRRP